MYGRRDHRRFCFDRTASAERGPGFQFLRLLIALYYLAGAGAIVLAVVAIARAGEEMLPAAVVLALAGLAQFGLAEAGKILLLLEQRSRQK